jgi:translation initiation factor 1
VILVAKRRELPPAEALTQNPFAALASLREQLAPGAPVEGPPPAPSPEPRDPAPTRGPARAVVRYQRKGRGGKEATIVEQLGLESVQLDEWCREIKRALGCGGHVEGELLVFGGDQRTRLPALLEHKGVRRVIVS